MDSNTVIQQAIANKMYTETDFVRRCDLPEPKTESFENRCIVLDVDRIECPMDMAEIEETVDGYNPSYVIVSDGRDVHIFKNGENGVEEIDDLPARCEDDPALEKRRADEVRRGLDEIIQNNKVFIVDDYAIEDFMAIAAYLNRNGLYTELSEVIDPFGFVGGVISRINEEFPGLVSQHAAKDFGSYLPELIRMAGLDLSPSKSLYEAYVEALAKLYSYRMIPQDVYELSKALIGTDDVMCLTDDPDRALIDASLPMTVECPYEINTTFTEFLSGHCNRHLETEGLDEEGEPLGLCFGNILAFPPWGFESDTAGGFRVLETSWFEQALFQLDKKGCMVAWMPESFLDDPSGCEIRKRLVEQKKLRAIVRVPERDGRNRGILVVVSDAPDEVFYYVDDSSGDVPMSAIVECCRGPAPAVGDLNERITPMNLGCDAENCHSISLNINANEKGMELQDLADVIRGVRVPADRCFPRGGAAGIPYADVSDMHDGTVDLTDPVRIPSALAAAVAQKGDVVMCVSGPTAGESAVVGDEPFVPCEKMAILRPKDFVSPETLVRALRKDDAVSQLALCVVGEDIPIRSLRKIRLVL